MENAVYIQYMDEILVFWNHILYITAIFNSPFFARPFGIIISAVIKMRELRFRDILTDKGYCGNYLS